MLVVPSVESIVIFPDEVVTVFVEILTFPIVAIPTTLRSLVVVRPVTPKVYIVAIPVTFRFAVSKLVEVRTPPTTITLLA